MEMIPNQSRTSRLILIGLVAVLASSGEESRNRLCARRLDRVISLPFALRSYTVPDGELWRLSWHSPYHAGEIAPAYDIRVVSGSPALGAEASIQANAFSPKANHAGPLDLAATKGEAVVWLWGQSAFSIANDRISVRASVFLTSDSPKASHSPDNTMNTQAACPQHFPDWIFEGDLVNPTSDDPAGGWPSIFMRDNFHCIYCSRNLSAELDAMLASVTDHIVPESILRKNQKAYNHRSNLAAACSVCNNLKGDYRPIPEDPAWLSREQFIHNVRERIKGERERKRRVYSKYLPSA